MKSITIKHLTKKELKEVNGGGKVAEAIGYVFHYLQDTFYKVALVDSTVGPKASY